MIDLNNPQQKKADNNIIIGLFLSLTILSLIVLFAVGAMLNKQTKNDHIISKTSFLSENNIETNIKEQGKLQKFTNYNELKDYLEENNLKNRELFARNSFTSPMLEKGKEVITPISSEDMTVSDPGNNKGGIDFSQTNIQVAGVDEADIIKTDGKYIYLIDGQKFIIIKAQPAAKAEIVSEIDLKANPQNLYIKDNYAAVFGNDYNLANKKHVDFIIPPNNFTFIKIYNTTDKTNPKLVREINFEGNYLNSRLIGDYIYFLTSKYPNILTDDILPRVIDNNKLVCSGNHLGQNRCPDIYYFNIPNPSPQITLISAINIKKTNQPIKQQAYLLNGTDNLYVSNKAIYITNTKYLDENQLMMEVTINYLKPRLDEKLKNKIAKISRADSDILSDREKLNKIYSIVQYYLGSLSPDEQSDISKEIEKITREKLKNLENELQKTIIHKISIEKDNLKNTAQGEVPGRVLNQFSMDENNDYFRIATTRDRHWSRFLKQPTETDNNLYILDKDLNITGKLEHLAPGERIYSVRFMQNRAYLITFKQIDPLFVIDLSQPTQPTILGELKIPGYSNYLHPYNNHILIGLGQETTTNEWGGVRNQGVKLSLFDVSDVAHPKEIDKYIFSEQNSHSLAQDDHKAFLFSKEKNLLAIPVSAWHSRDNEKNYNAAMVFNVNEKGFKFKGKINHNQSSCSSDDCEKINDYNYDTQVLRSLFIGNDLYTMSAKYLKINNLNTLDELKTLTIFQQNYRPEPIPIPLRSPEKTEEIIQEIF